MKTIQQKIRLFVVVLALSSQAQAGTVAGTGGALEITQEGQAYADVADRAVSYTKQLQQYSTQILQYEQQVQQYMNQFLSFEMMLANIGILPEAQWRQFQEITKNLKNIVETGQAISYTAANFDTKFTLMYKGYDEYFKQAKLKFAGEGKQEIELIDEYKHMYQSTSDTVKGALKSLGLQEEDLSNDEAVMSVLKTQSETAFGQKAAIQAANQIALHQTTQLKKLQKTIMTQANIQGNWIAAQSNKESLSKAAFEAFMHNPEEEEMNHNDDKPMP